MQGATGLLKSFLSRLGEALFPAVCECCGRSLVEGESTICLHCLYGMPRTGFHHENFSELHKRLAAPGVPIERTAAMFHYIKESPHARLIQRAKYNDRPGIARKLGEMFARELSGESFFDGIDMLLPIPLHRLKLMRRGYNQSVEIARGINRATGIPVGDNLTALPHSTQTRKNAVERAANMEGKICVIAPEELEGKHLLLIDDVITTGATLLTAAKALKRKAPTCRISVLTLAASKMV